jgi:STE24 endopeptidase
MRLAAAAVGLAAVAVAWVLGANALSDTIVPDGLRLPQEAAARSFDAAAAAEARDFEAVVRWLLVASQLTAVVVLAVYARYGGRFAKESAAGPIGTGFLLGMMGFAMVWLVQVPFGLVETWWSRKHDIVEVGYVEWLAGDFFALGGEALLVCLVLLIVMALARLVRGWWWAPAVAAVAAIALFVAWLSPYLLPGLERPSPAVAADARRMADRTGVPRTPVRIEEVREFTEAPNAYALGLSGTRRVVLFDTLAEDFPRPEVRTVIAHEFAHHGHDHIVKGIGWLALGMVPAALIVALVTRRRGGLADPRAVPLALLVFVLVQLALTPVQSAAIRRYEAEADWAALTATRDPKAMERLFRRFTDEGLADPDPPGWFHWAFDTHPSGSERVAMAMAWRERRAGR